MKTLDDKCLNEVLTELLKERSSIDSMFCYSCLAFGIAIPDSMHYRTDMEGGPISSTQKCSHCYVTEAEHGKFKFTKEENDYAQKVIDTFERLEKLKN